MTKRRSVVAAGSHSYGYDANGNMSSRDGSTISYTSYDLPSVIASGANSSTSASAHGLQVAPVRRRPGT